MGRSNDYRAAVTLLARAIRHGAQRHHEQVGTGRYRATVLAKTPLRLDVHGLDIDLDENDVQIGKGVTATGFAVGDTLVLVEVDDMEFTAVEVDP